MVDPVAAPELARDSEALAVPEGESAVLALELVESAELAEESAAQVAPVEGRVLVAEAREQVAEVRAEQEKLHQESG